MPINYGEDLVKHFVRMNGWLPNCQARVQSIKTSANPRRLRYLTFCDFRAVDVLMLDVAKVLTKSTANKFDSVVFFDRDEEAVFETQTRIPGAIGFPGDFIKVVLLDSDDDIDVLDTPSDEMMSAAISDTMEVRRRQNLMLNRRRLIERFPFDVINLDLEEYLFKPRDELPGKVINALQRLFEWQRRPLCSSSGPAVPLAGFSLMLTTRVGPPNIAGHHDEMLKECLERNLLDDASLGNLLEQRAGTRSATALRQANFELFFKLSVPKIIAKSLLNSDWFIDPDSGIQIFQFQREPSSGPYQMLHIIMNVTRQNPIKDRRSPDNVCTPEASSAYRSVVRKLIATPETNVDESRFTEQEISVLKQSLERIASRAKKYRGE